MILSINQPAYLPWLGYFDRLAKSDLHIVLDHVQFEKNSVTNRNRIRQPVGWSWLTVPLKTKGKFGDLAINAVEIDYKQPWRKKHWRAIQSNYRRAAFFEQHEKFFENLYSREWPSLVSLVGETTQHLREVLNISTKCISSAAMNPVGAKDALILELCEKVGADTYISGPFGRDYLDPDIFRKRGIQVLFHDYRHPEYSQAFAGFEPFMSVIDLLFNQGPNSRAMLENSRDSLVEA